MGYRDSGTKSFQADPIKQFLISRGTARDRAVDLCCAGKIKIEEIPIMTDKLTILHFGKIEVSPQVDAEVMRIAARLWDKLAKKDVSPEPTPRSDLCDSCTRIYEGCDITDNQRPVTMCRDYYSNDDKQADANKQLQDEADERQRAEDELNDSKKDVPVKEEYVCTKCDGRYKTAKGLAKHVKAKHGGE